MRPLTQDWVQAYRRRRRQKTPDLRQIEVGVESEELAPETPHPIQHEALAALRQARQAGHRAGLVVLATGLGKTWLAAFDSEAFAHEDREARAAGQHAQATGVTSVETTEPVHQQTTSPRILFVAHREEILDQAMATFRLVRPGATLGRFTGKAKQAQAEILFASIQTLGRSHHLESFAPDHFDYIVVDEFHHAAARTYGCNLLALCGSS